MKTKDRARAKRSLNRPRSTNDRGQTVRRLAAEGHSGDVISALMQVNKNTLRAKHALDLERGRQIAQAEAETAEIEKLSAKEEEMRRAMFAGFGTHWENPDGTNVLQDGRTLAETEKLWSEWLRRHRGS
jgi:hypothetical protein